MPPGSLSTLAVIKPGPDDRHKGEQTKSDGSPGAYGSLPRSGWSDLGHDKDFAVGACATAQPRVRNGQLQ